MPGEPRVPAPRTGAHSWYSVSASAWPGCPRKLWSALGTVLGWDAPRPCSACTQPSFLEQPWCSLQPTSARGAPGASAQRWHLFLVLCQRPRKPWGVLGPVPGWDVLWIHSTCTQPRFLGQPWHSLWPGALIPVPGKPWVPVPRAGAYSWYSVSASAWPRCPRKPWGWFLEPWPRSAWTQPSFLEQPRCSLWPGAPLPTPGAPGVPAPAARAWRCCPGEPRISHAHYPLQRPEKARRGPMPVGDRCRWVPASSCIQAQIL